MIFRSVLLVIYCVFLAGCQTLVTVTSSESILRASETATITANVVNSVALVGTPVTNTTVNFDRSPAVGSIGASAATDALGNATVTYTAGVVVEDTLVEIEADATRTGTVTVTVLPANGYANFGGAAVVAGTPSDITVSPSVSDVSAGKEYTYQIRSTSTPPISFNKVGIDLQAPMTLSRGSYTRSHPPSNNSWLFDFPAGTTSGTIIFQGDVNVGGNADVDVLIVSPSGVTHATVTVTGPIP